MAFLGAEEFLELTVDEVDQWGDALAVAGSGLCLGSRGDLLPPLL